MTGFAVTAASVPACQYVPHEVRLRRTGRWDTIQPISAAVSFVVVVVVAVELGFGLHVSLTTFQCSSRAEAH